MSRFAGGRDGRAVERREWQTALTEAMIETYGPGSQSVLADVDLDDYWPGLTPEAACEAIVADMATREEERRERAIAKRAADEAIRATR